MLQLEIQAQLHREHLLHDARVWRVRREQVGQANAFRPYTRWVAALAAALTVLLPFLSGRARIG